MLALQGYIEGNAGLVALASFLSFLAMCITLAVSIAAKFIRAHLWARMIRRCGGSP